MSEYYSPYNAILSHLFPIEEDYLVVPLYKCPKQAQSVDFITVFVVRHQEHLVFFIEVKACRHTQHISSHEKAGFQMQERFQNLFDHVDISVLYGVSAIGSKLCLYVWIKLAAPCRNQFQLI